MKQPLLQVQGLVKRYRRGWPRAETTFELRADFRVDEPAVIGVMGANGAGKTTLFELITGGNQPSEGQVLVGGTRSSIVLAARRSTSAAMRSSAARALRRAMA